MPFDPLSDADIVRKRLLAEQDQAIDDAHLPPTPEEGDPIPAADPSQPSTPPIPITQEVKEPPANWQTALVAKHYPELTPLSLQTPKPSALDNAVDVSGPAQEPDDGSDVLAPLPPARGKKPPAQLAKPPASALPGPGMGDVKEADSTAGSDEPTPTAANNPDRAASLVPPLAPTQPDDSAPSPEPAPAPGPAPIPSRQSFALPAVSDGSHDKMLEALYHAGTRTALPDSFFQPKASQDPELLALKKMLLEKNIMAPPKGGQQQIKPQDDATSPRSLIAQHFTTQTRPDVLKLAGGGDPAKGEEAIRQMSETQILALVKQADAGTKIGQGANRIDQAASRQTALNSRTEQYLKLHNESMDTALGKRIPDGTRAAVQLGAEIDALVDELGGPDKVSGIGAIEGAFPDAMVGNKIMQLRHDARVLRQQGLHGAFGARLTEWETTQWDKAYGQIDGAHTLDQVMMGIHNMRAMAMAKAEQAMAGASAERKQKVVQDLTGPGVMPQPPPAKGTAGSSIPSTPPNPALGWAAQAAKFGKGAIDYLTGAAQAPANQSTNQPAPTPAPKEGDTAQLNGKTYVVKNGKWHERGE